MTHTKYHGSGRLYTEMELDERADALSRLHASKNTYQPKITPGLLDKLLARAKRFLFHGRG